MYANEKDDYENVWTHHDDDRVDRWGDQDVPADDTPQDSTPLQVDQESSALGDFVVDASGNRHLQGKRKAILPGEGEDGAPIDVEPSVGGSFRQPCEDPLGR